MPSICAQLLAGAVVGAVVDDDDLVAVRRRVERGADAVDLRAQVALLVVDGQHDGDVELLPVGRLDRVAHGVLLTAAWQPQNSELPRHKVLATGSGVTDAVDSGGGGGTTDRRAQPPGRVPDAGIDADRGEQHDRDVEQVRDTASSQT